MSSMKQKRLALVFACAILACLASGFISSFFVKPFEPEHKEKEFTVCASCYPVYAVSSLIIGNVPGMRLTQLTQPQLKGYTDYELSDWDKAILSKADVFVQMGFGFEGFSGEAADNEAAIITLLSLMELKTVPSDCTILNYMQSDDMNVNSPWLYMSVDGMMELCEVMCGNMAYLDQVYSEQYYNNLYTAENLFKPLKNRVENTDTLKGKKVAIAHDGLLYTAYDLCADVELYIRRSTAQELDLEQVEECIAMMKNHGISILLIEKEASQEMQSSFEAADITVIRQQLMLDRSPAFTSQGYIDALNENLDAIEGAFTR